MKRFDLDEKQWTLLAVGLIVLHALMNLLWLQMDRTPPLSDSIYYIQGGFKLLANLQNDGWQGLSSVPELTPHRPPLLSLLAAAILPTVKNVPDRIVWINAVFYAGAVWISFCFARRLAGGAAGFCAAMFLMSNPFVFPYLSDFEAELPLMFFTIATLWFLFRIAAGAGWSDFIGLGFCFAAGILLKWLYGVIVFVPAMAVFGLLLVNQKDPESREKSWRRILTAMAIPAVIALPWYAAHYTDLIQYQSEVKRSGLFTPFHEGWSVYTLIYYPLLLAYKIKIFHLITLLAGIIGGVLLLGRKGESSQRAAGMLLGLSLLTPWLFFVINDHNLAEKYLLPVQPILAVLAGFSIVRLRPVWRFRAALGVFVLFLLIVLHGQWGFFGSGRNAPPLIQSDLWLKPQTGMTRFPIRTPRREEFPHRTIAQTIALQYGGKSKPPKVMTIPNLPFFNAFHLSVWLQAEIPKAESLGVSRYRIILDLLFHDFLIASSGAAHGEIEHRDRVDPYRYETTTRLAQWYESSPAWLMENHRLINQYDDPYDESVLNVFERSGPVKKEEAVEIIGLFAEEIVQYDFMWDQIAIVWKRLKESVLEERAKAFQEALFYGGEQTAEQLFESYEEGRIDLFPYEQYALAVKAGQHRRMPLMQNLIHSIVNKKTTCAAAAKRLLN
ncbi:MAG: glycosyltransferase family 39 protein [Candidatus Omnitrophica bacterium]|nr:glycosyltransferase family 39 protein [Candidatus Omnitrophota bacterium]